MRLRGLGRSILGRAAGSSTASFGVDLVERLVPVREDVLAVLTYHRIAARSSETGSPPSLISSTPDEFEQQVALVARRYRPLGLDDLIRTIRTRAVRLPSRSVLITFDDGYPDFAEHAWPILARWGVPATLFVPTAYPGSSNAMFWWDRLHRLLNHDRDARITLGSTSFALATEAERRRAYRHLHEYLNNSAPGAVEPTLEGLELQINNLPLPKRSTLTWDELRRLKAEGVSLAPHSKTHPRLDLLSEHDLAEEVAGSLARLRAEVGACSPAFAYPGGYYNPSVVRSVREAGYELAFTTERGLNDLRSMAPFLIRRLNIGSRSSPTLIRAQLLPIGMGKIRDR